MTPSPVVGEGWGGGLDVDLELAAHDALSLQGFGAMQSTTVLFDGPAADETDSPWSMPHQANTVRTSATSGSGTGVSPVGNQPPPSQHAIDPTLPLLEDELLAELAAFSLHAWFDDLQRDAPPVILAPPQPSPIAAPTSPPNAEPSASPADATNTSDGNTSATSGSGTGVSPVAAPTSASRSTATLFVSASFAAPTAATEPAITSMALTRTTDWKGDGGTATVAVEVHNGTGSSLAEGDYWITFFVDGGIEGITLPEPTHAVPALAAGETSEASALATDVVVTPGAQRDLYHLRAALVSNPKAPPREPAPLLVEAVTELSIHWVADPTVAGGMQTMGGGGGQGGGVPHIDSLDLAPFSIWTEISGSAYATANVCNDSGAPVIEGQYGVEFSVDNNPPGFDVPDPNHTVPGLADGACALVPPWTGTPINVDASAATGTYTVRATIPNVDSKTHPLYVVEVTDWQVEWENPPGSGTWVAPDGQLPDGTPYVWSHDTMRWTALGMSPKDPPAVTQIDWLARPWGTSDPWTTFATIAGEGPATGAPAPGDWDITPKVYFEGQGTAQMPEPKRFVVAKIDSVTWAQRTGVDAGQLIADGGNFRFYPGAQQPGEGFRVWVDVHAAVEPGVPGIAVNFQSFDVDDPSDLDGPVDDDSDANDVNENDNFGGQVANPQVQRSRTGRVSRSSVSGRPSNPATITASPPPGAKTSSPSSSPTSRPIPSSSTTSTATTSIRLRRKGHFLTKTTPPAART